MSIIIIKYNAGNVFSVQNALKRLGVESIVSGDKKVIENADKIIFPGVGEASSTMHYLHQSGLDKVIKNIQKPILGICLGMQVMCKHSEEGNVDCLNIFDIDVKRFKPTADFHKIPHMGWNLITDLKGDLYNSALENEYVYFVHSYYVPICENTTATSEYIKKFSASLNKDNFYATQFHPEKSGEIGEAILKNFLELDR